MTEKILFVDDDRAVLDGFRRILDRDFDVETAVGGERGLAVIQVLGPFAVVISDMRMPGMNGAEFLALVRQRAPETVRMLLTGHTDINSAADAVNEGNIFRYLTKPCGREALVKAIEIGLIQYRSLAAERTLVKNAMTIELSRSDRTTSNLCQLDKGESPMSLPGPSPDTQ